jgi:Arc/MetJ-type ribon-helix-helix transcriptional regulator
MGKDNLINLTLSDALMEFLNQMSEKTGVNHSDLIRSSIAGWMEVETEYAARERELKELKRKRLPNGAVAVPSGPPI